MLPSTLPGRPPSSDFGRKKRLCHQDFAPRLTPRIGRKMDIPSEQRFFSQMMDFSFVENSQKVRAATCVIRCVPRSLAKLIRVAR